MISSSKFLTSPKSATPAPTDHVCDARSFASENDLSSVYIDESVRQCVDLLNRAWPASTLAADKDDSKPSSDLPAHVAPGTRWGRFLLRRKVGQGSYGVVFLAFDELLRREVAVKIPQPHVLASTSSLRRFLREAEAAAQLDHAGIMPTFEVGEVGAIVYIVSDYCAGPNLAEWLATQPQPISPEIAAGIVCRVAEAVHHAHSHGVLHRDLKPANILLDPRSPLTDPQFPFNPRISDFGLAKVAGSSAAASATEAGMLIGTLRYMAPEQADGRNQDVGVQTDVWALGSILYELLAGHPAFERDDAALLNQIQSEEPHPLAAVNPRVPADLANICHRCLQKSPAHRYPSARDLMLDLKRFLRDEPVLARPLGAATRLARWSRRRPAIAALACALTFVAFGGAVGIAWQWRRANIESGAARAAADATERHLAQAQSALLDFAWLVQEFALYRRPEDPVPEDLWDRVSIDSANGIESSTPLQLPLLAAHSLFLANKFATSGDQQTALANFEQGTAVWLEIVRKQPGNEAYRRALALACYSHAVSLSRLGHSQAAQNKLRDARRAFAADLSDTTLDVEAMLKNANVAETVGKSLKLRNRVGESLDAYREALTVAKDARQRAPHSLQAQYLAATYAVDVGQTEVELGDRQAALVEYNLAREIVDQLCDHSPQSESYLELKVDIAMQTAEIQRREHNVRRAALDYQRAIDDADEGQQFFPDRIAWPRRLAIAHAQFGKFKLVFKNYESAKTNFLQACEIWKTLRQENALPDKEAIQWGIACYELARLDDRQKQYEQAIANASQATSILEATRMAIRESREERLAREGASVLVARLKLRDEVVTLTEDQ